MDTNSLAHTKWECQYHIVFIPKYRQKRLYGQIRADVKEIIKTLCKYKGVEIMEGAVCVDHVHLHVSIPPKYSISDFMAFWARGYYVATIGTISEETIKKYIMEQAEEDKKEERLANM